MSNFNRIVLTLFIYVFLGEPIISASEIKIPFEKECVNVCNVGDEWYRVVKVIDGDTFWVEGNNRRFKVRIIGVDAPETRNSRYKKQGYYGQEAKDFVRNLIDGKFVRLEYDVQTIDKYQRDLAYVYLEDGTFLNEVLLQGGYAVVATFPPNIRYVEYFLQVQREARESRRGLWTQ